MLVAERVEAQRALLSAAERRVAEAVLTEPEAVAFGTVAALADRGGTSGATVVRLARRLGYDGFVELQAAVRDDLMDRAAHRIRQPAPADVVERTLAVELDNVQRALGAVDRDDFARAVQLLSARSGQVFVVAGDASSSVAELFATELGMLRAGVQALIGSRARVQRGLAALQPGDVVLTIDIRRYEHDVLTTADYATGHGVERIAGTDSVLSPLADGAITFVAGVAGAGPFDSHVGILSMLNALSAAVAARLRASASDRLDRIESAWEAAAVLLER